MPRCYGVDHYVDATVSIGKLAYYSLTGSFVCDITIGNFYCLWIGTQLLGLAQARHINVKPDNLRASVNKLVANSAAKAGGSTKYDGAAIE